jgi:hypothetical protein
VPKKGENSRNWRELEQNLIETGGFSETTKKWLGWVTVSEVT